MAVSSRSRYDLILPSAWLHEPRQRWPLQEPVVTIARGRTSPKAADQSNWGKFMSLNRRQYALSTSSLLPICFCLPLFSCSSLHFASLDVGQNVPAVTVCGRHWCFLLELKRNNIKGEKWQLGQLLCVSHRCRDQLPLWWKTTCILLAIS